MFKKSHKLSNIEQRYCSCLIKVRGKSKELKKNNIISPYGICTNSIYNFRHKKRTKRLGCLKYIDFNKLTFLQLKALAIEKKLNIRKKGRYISKKNMISKLNRFIKN
jgi:hypothetical protein